VEYKYSLDLKNYVWDITSISVILLVASLTIIFNTVVSEITFYTTLDFTLKIIVPLVLTVIIHELVHIASAIMLGYKAKIGYGRVKFTPVFYVRIKDGIMRKHYITITLTPLIAFSTITLILALITPNILAKEILSTMFIMNTAGSSGDIVLTLSAIKIDKKALIEDYGTSIVSNKPIPKPYSRTVGLILKIITIMLLILIAVQLKIEIGKIP